MNLVFHWKLSSQQTEDNKLTFFINIDAEYIYIRIRHSFLNIVWGNTKIFCIVIWQRTNPFKLEGSILYAEQPKQ